MITYWWSILTTMDTKYTGTGLVFGIKRGKLKQRSTVKRIMVML